MTAKAYKSPLGFRFTAEEERLYRRAIKSAVEFFKTYGRGRQPSNVDRVVRDRSPYEYCRYYEKPVGSLQAVVKENPHPITEAEGEWMTTQQLSVLLCLSKPTIARIARSGGIAPRKIRVGRAHTNLYRKSEIMAARERQDKIRQMPDYNDGPALTSAEFISGKWMRCSPIARQLGIPDQCLCNMLISYNIPFKLYAERKQPFKFYDIDVVREHPKVKKLIAKYNR